MDNPVQDLFELVHRRTYWQVGLQKFLPCWSVHCAFVLVLKVHTLEVNDEFSAQGEMREKRCHFSISCKACELNVTTWKATYMFPYQERQNTKKQCLEE